MRTLVATTLLLSMLALAALAQDAPRERRVAPGNASPPGAPATQPGLRGPVLTGDDGKPVAGVSLARADIGAVVNASLAETTLLLTFANANDRVLGGEIVFPLPEGATVTGYGLDVNGVMVDGVAVEKQRARVIYEQEMNKSVDPGLVEHVAGNNFRTRLYPIPARGTRKVKIQYVAPLAAQDGKGGLSLPTQWGDDLREASVRVEVRNTETAPRIAADGGEQKVEKTENGVVVQMSIPVAELRRGLNVVLPPVPNRSVAIEKRLKPVATVDDLDEQAKGGDAAGQFDQHEHFFVIHDTPPMTRREPTRKPDAHVAIFWDASLSRADSDKERELKLLETLLTRSAVASADVIVFRNNADRTVGFNVKNDGPGKLIEHLRGVTYDGATSLGTLSLPKGSSRVFDYVLLFTDGLGNLGAEAPKAPEAPVYAISNDEQANPALLRVLCQQSGGAYFNLKNVADEQVLAGFGEPPYSLVSVDFKEGEVAEVFPTPGAAVQGRFTASGRLLVPEATVTLNYGFGKEITHRETFTLKAADAAVGTLVPRFWAQQKVAELSLFADRNADALAQVGKQFNLVTPNTSLLVLETADQYVQHRVVPPKDRPDVYKEFLAKIEQHKAQEVATKEQKTQQVLAMWQQRVKWWETEFRYPADLKVIAKNGAGGRGGAATQPALAPAAGVPDRAVATGQPAAREVARGQTVQRQAGQQPASPPTAGPAPADPAPPAPSRRPAAAGRPLSETAGVEMSLSSADTDAPLGRGEGRADARGLSSAGVSGGGQFREREVRLAQVEQQLRQLPAQGREDEVQRLKRQISDLTNATDAGVEIKSWDPNTPYLQAMKAVTNDKAYGVYLEQRKQFRKSPAFYLDCADYLVKAGQRDLGIRVLTNVAELQLEDARLLRVAAHRLNQIGERGLAIDLFEKVLKLRPEEPQSHRDLALALADRAEQIIASADKATRERDLMLSKVKGDYGRALDLLNKVITSNWDRFREIEVIALMEANQIMARLSRMPELGEVPNPIDPRLRENLDLDVRVVMTWDADMTDIDLWVTEPSGEKCFYGHNRTTIGGVVSQDFTQGYGPEEYCLRKLMPGEYKIQANFYGSRQQELTGPCTVQATVITNFGRPDEKRQALTLRLSSAKEVVDIGTVKLGAPQK